VAKAARRSFSEGGPIDNGYDNSVPSITATVLPRFIDPAPFV
jgi:hypothetical protein